LPAYRREEIHGYRRAIERGGWIKYKEKRVCVKQFLDADREIRRTSKSKT